jgi:flagellar biosynthesis protein FliP
MTPKQTALLNMGKLLGIALVAGLGASMLIANFTVEQIGIGFCVGMIVYLCKMVYDIELSKAEHLEALNKLNK